VNTAYLVNELNANYVQEQLDTYRMGGTIPIIRRDDLLKVKIKLPSINEQIAKMQGIEELSNKINVLKKERNAIVHGQSNSQFKEFASLKHTLGRPRQNILDWSDNLLDFLASKENEIAAINKEFAEFYDRDILTALTEIKNDINFITEVLEKGEDGLIITKGKYPKDLISLAEIKSIINDLSRNGFNFQINRPTYKGEKLKVRGIECNVTLLKILIDNLFTNANKHAFSKNEPNNEVVIELSEVKGFLELEIKNNGKAFPRNIDKEKFITKYSTSNSIEGSGLGGYDINRIAEYHENPDWELILNEDPIYKVRFKFRFPIKLIK
jgi:type I restriction enzyme M protein